LGAFNSIALFSNILQNLVNQGLISITTKNEIENHPWAEIESAMGDILSPVTTLYNDLLLQEFNALIEASQNGAPPVHGPRPSSPVLFEVLPNSYRRIPGPNGRILRVTPIPRLRTVMVQIGYTRAVDSGLPQIVDVSFPDAQNPQQKWYPGVEFPGEGIFVSLDSNDGWQFQFTGSANDQWSATFANPQNYPNQVFRSASRDELHPVFVWWHTLAHVLIRAISIDAGYSSASIRERIYLEVDTQGNRVRGGIILYATQPGSEGTMGGLIALLPHFDHILETAMGMLHSCSNDPLCDDTKFQPGGYSGPACYACLLVSETSCECRNLWLDRELWLQNRL
jgi:hypothetical protein